MEIIYDEKLIDYKYKFDKNIHIYIFDYSLSVCMCVDLYVCHVLDEYSQKIPKINNFQR